MHASVYYQVKVKNGYVVNSQWVKYRSVIGQNSESQQSTIKPPKDLVKVLTCVCSCD